MNIQQYNRKPFPVRAVQVTQENMIEVAEWCGGRIRQTGGKHYIKVDVAYPVNPKQTEAWPTDWVLEMGGKFKVYLDDAFHRNFDEDQNVVNVFESGHTNQVYHNQVNPQDAIRGKRR